MAGVEFAYVRQQQGASVNGGQHSNYEPWRCQLFPLTTWIDTLRHDVDLAGALKLRQLTARPLHVFRYGLIPTLFSSTRRLGCKYQSLCNPSDRHYLSYW